MTEPGASEGRRIAVVGGGWSGLAAAIELAGAGHAPALYEAAPQFGGRARGVVLALGDRVYPLDNGQHLLLGACRATLALLARAGVDPAQAFIRRPFALHDADGFRLQAAALPAPWHLVAAVLTASGLPWSARGALVAALARWRLCRWTAAEGASVADLLRGQPPLLVERLWEPLCVAALNARPAAASAGMFLAVLRDSLGGGRAASELLLPRGDLSALLPDAAAAFLARHGAGLRLRSAVERIEADPAAADGWRLHTRADCCRFDAVVLALPPARAAALLEGTGDPRLAATVAQLQAIDTAPIATVYLRYPPGMRLPQPMHALREDIARRRPGQWAFDRGALDPRCDGVFSVVVSAERPAALQDHAALGSAVATQLTEDFALPAPLAWRVIEDKRATLRPRPGLRRPPAVLPVAGLFLAGDAADSTYPSTIEGSVRSGLAAARALLGVAGGPPARPARR